jgi:hypothetical protein
MRGISGAAKDLLASEKGLCSMELVCYYPKLKTGALTMFSCFLASSSTLMMEAAGSSETSVDVGLYQNTGCAAHKTVPVTLTNTAIRTSNPTGIYNMYFSTDILVTKWKTKR